MKKILLSIFTLLALLSVQLTFANQDANYQVKMGSIADASGPKALGLETDVAVINYTNSDLFVNFGISSFNLPHQTSGRIISSTQRYILPMWIYYSGQQIFYNSGLSPFATVSIYYINGQFVTYVSDN
jgi:hypothetical protein